ncbi:MAG: fasciclin domain-containing protein [Chloroflexota bacterium]|nr:fasciclin domain-containing protein [Chloroflexota bacterium]
MFSNLTFTKTIFLTFLVFTLLFAFVACGEDEVVVTTTASEEVEEIKIIEKSTPYPEKETKQSIAEIAVDGGFNTLVAALDAADLVETLSGDGTFTVFAPTDDAFAALPEGMLEELLADPETLKQILLYHVVGDVVMAETVVTLDEAETLEGSMVAIDVVDGNVFLNDSQVTSTDIEASNGVVHVIDKVLVPGMQEAASNETLEESKSIAEIAVAGGFNTLVAALSAADLVETLSGDGAFTVFAPTDDAFAALPEGMLEGLLADTESLTQILLYHVVGDVVMADTVVTLDEAETLEGSKVEIEVVDGKVFVNDSQVTSTDIEASNGVIHVIDKVLVPGMDETGNNKKLIDDQIPNFVVYEYSDAETDYTFRRLVIRDIIESTLEKSSTKTQISQQIPVGIYETSQVQLSSVIPLGLIEAQIPQVF